MEHRNSHRSIDNQSVASSEKSFSSFQLKNGSGKKKNDYELGVIAYSNGEYDSAITYFTSVIEKPKKFDTKIRAQACNNIGFLYDTQYQKHKEALKFYDQAIELNPKNSVAFVNRGSIFEHHFKKYEKALEDYDTAIKLNSKDADVFHHRATLLENHFQRYEDALADYTKVIELNPKHDSAYNNRGLLLRDHFQKYSEALTDFNEATKINGTQANRYAQKAYTLYLMQRYDAALSAASKAIELDPAFGFSYYVMGLAYSTQKKYSKAAANLRKFTTLRCWDPKYIEDAKQQVETMEKSGLVNPDDNEKSDVEPKPIEKQTTPPPSQQQQNQTKAPKMTREIKKKKQQQVQEMISRDEVQLIVQQIMNNEVDVDTKNERGESLIQQAVQNGSTATLRVLLENSADVNEPNHRGQRALHIAIITHNIDACKSLIEHNANVNDCDYDGNSPLHIATENGDYNLAKILLERGADVNDQNSEGNTPLHIAISKGYTNIIKLLLQHGAMVEIPNSNLQTPLDVINEMKNIAALNSTNAGMLQMQLNAKAIEEELAKHDAKRVAPAPPVTSNMTIVYSEQSGKNAALSLFFHQTLDVLNKLKKQQLCCAKSLSQQDEIRVKQFIERSEILLLIISEGAFENQGFVSVIQYALEQKRKLILVHDILCRFPALESLPLSLQTYHIFDDIAVPLVNQYATNCWERILKKIDKWKSGEMENIATDLFLSHRQLTGQRIALALYEQLTSKHNKKVFLDVRVDFDLHNLDKIVEETKNFVFILTEGIFDSLYCFQELVGAVKIGKHIIVLQDAMYRFEAIPDKWNQFTNLFYSDDVILFHANYLTECTNKLVAQLKN